MVRSLPTRSDHLRHPRFSARPGSFCFRLQMYVFFRFVVFSKITIFRKTVDFFSIFPKKASFFQHAHRFYTLFSENRPIFSCIIRKIADFRKFEFLRIFNTNIQLLHHNIPTPVATHPKRMPPRSETLPFRNESSRKRRTTVILLTISWYNARFFFFFHVRKDTYPILISK